MGCRVGPAHTPMAQAGSIPIAPPSAMQHHLSQLLSKASAVPTWPLLFPRENQEASY